MLRIVLLSLFLASFSGTAMGGKLFRANHCFSPSRSTEPGDSKACFASAAEPVFSDTVPTVGNGLSAESDSILQKRDSVRANEKAAKKAQKTSDNIYKDSVLRKGANPRRATIYSAILPGLGQIYNRKYWKLPLVYAAVGIPAYAFFYNKSWYKKCQYALTVTVNQSPADSVARVDKSLLPFVTAGDVSGLITNRDSFRKNQDYSVLFFLLFYGLQVVDATVDAHLKGFNVNDDLSLKITPTLLSSSSSLAGISLVFDIHKPFPRPLRVN